MQVEVKNLLALTGRLPLNTAISLAAGYAPVAELADALDLKSSGYYNRVGSNPTRGINRYIYFA